MIEATEVWKSLAALLPKNAISWRQDGKPTSRDGKFLARFVCYVEAGTVRERLDSVVPGEWSLTTEALPPLPYASDEDTSVSMRARLTIRGVIREDVGTGENYKMAATDAFKRAAVRFGIGHELYSMDQCWVEVDGDGKYAKALEDPQTVYDRKHRSGAESKAADIKSRPAPREGAASEQTGGQTPRAAADKLMPFGKTKGKRLGDLNYGELDSAREWCTKKDAPGFKDLIAAIEEVITSRNVRPAPALVGTESFESFPRALEEVDDDLPF